MDNADDLRCMVALFVAARREFYRNSAQRVQILEFQQKSPDGAGHFLKRVAGLAADA
ncbi:MAG: hypothetical protein RL404_833 [Pseudomonadota bacterium]|jgi:hypothetical protein